MFSFEIYFKWSLLTHRYSDQEGNEFEFSKFYQKMDIESFPIKSEDFVTG